jgi:hypothetical protein
VHNPLVHVPHPFNPLVHVEKHTVPVKSLGLIPVLHGIHVLEDSLSFALQDVHEVGAPAHL